MHGHRFASVAVAIMAFGAILAAASGCAASGPSFPSHEVTVVVTWAAGGQTDLTARALMEATKRYLGAEIVVKNTVGGSGTVGAAEVAAAKPDGYTLAFVSAAPWVTAPHMISIPYDPLKDFVPIIEVGKTTQVWVVKADSPYKTLKDFVDAAKAKPGQLSFGNAGQGTTNHLGVLKFSKLAGFEVKHVPFASANEQGMAVLGGHIDIGSPEMVGVIQHIREGRLRALAILESQRYKLTPDIPTAKEQGYDVAICGWNGVAAPKNTPKEVAQKLHDAFKKGMEDKTFQDAAEKLTYNVGYAGPEDFYKRWETEYKMFGDLMKEAGLTKK